MLKATLAGLAVMFAVAACNAQGQSPLVYQELPQGTTPAAAVGSFRVGYRVFSGPPGITYLPAGVTGDNEYGATYEPRWSDIFMHPAWRKGAGTTVVEYFVHLPKVSPAEFKMGCYLSPQAVGQSDGVLFRIYAGPYEHRKILWEQDVATATPVQATVDLSPWAGKDLVLGIEANPGPKHDTSYDWSNLSDPRFVLGSGTAPPAQLGAAERARLEALYAAGLKPYLDNRHSAGPSAGPLASGKTSIKALGNRRWRVSFTSPHWKVDYDIDLSTGDLGGLHVRQDGQTWQLFLIGGPELDLGGTSYPAGSPKVKRQCLSAAERDGKLVARYRYSAPGGAAVWSLTITPDGPYLRLDLASDSQDISALRWGAPAGFRVGMPVFVPYMYNSDVERVNDGFACAVPDLWHSNASIGGPHSATYLKRTDGKRNPLHETLWTGYVPLVEMALQNIPNPQSPYLADMSQRPIFDIWGGTFAEIEARLKQLAHYGLNHGFIIIHNWQRAGYDQQYPDVLPARASLGGNAALKALCDTANGLGYRIAVHENYVDFYPNAPSWTPADIALDSSGKMVKAWFQPATHIQSFLMKPSTVLKWAGRFSPRIHKDFDTSGAYLDVHTAVAPWDKEDYDARVPDAGEYTATFRDYARLFQFMRDTHHGPETGEGNNHALWAGCTDGCEAQVSGGEKVPAMLAYDLLKIHPENINHGMGYWTRWVAGPPVVGLPNLRYPITIDKYEAQTITFGHAGFLDGFDIASDYQAVRRYHLTRWLQAQYGTATPVSVTYDVGGREVSLSEALLRYAPLERVHITYSNGLQLWVNWGEKTWAVHGYLLPQWGYLAEGKGFLQSCALRSPEGARAGAAGTKSAAADVVGDYMQSADWILADGRADAATTSLAQSLVNVVPKVAAFKQTGPRTFQITYQWTCRSATTRSPHIFVHFTSPLAGGDENIAFQNDHEATPPVDQWKAGKTYTDGPYTVEVPDKYAKPGVIGVMVGMFDNAGRAILAVEENSKQKVHVGDIKVAGAGDNTTLTYVPAKERMLNTRAAMELLRAHTNAAAVPLDFGPVVTAHCVLLHRVGDRLDVLAVPRDQAERVGLRMSRLPEAWRSLKPPAGREEGGVLWVELRPEK